MLLRLPPSLHYPITITSLLVQDGDPVSQGMDLFSYYYKTVVTEGDGMGGKRNVERSFPTRFQSPVDGSLVGWMVKQGDLIERPINVAEIEEPCSHDVQFGGMCATCAKDLTELNYTTEAIEPRAAIQMTHDNSALTVSQEEARRIEESAKRRLLMSRRLSLVVDLDQTIIHATVDPTVGEWQQDPSNPNYEAVKEVRSFQLAEDGLGQVGQKEGPDGTVSEASLGCWYYIKLRPGLREFLERISKMYELHIYTMGTRAYAQAVANIVDPDHKIFGDRILSRDESGSMTAKNLQRLFPVDTKMVVIIDDRGDVWKWTENLIKVSPYDFFVGIGDINSSFLPQKPDLEAPQQEKPVEGGVGEGQKLAGTTDEQQETQGLPAVAEKIKDKEKARDEGEVSTIDRLLTMSGGDNPALLHQQAEKQGETIQHQVEDRPLLRQQKALDAEDTADEQPTPQTEPMDISRSETPSVSTPSDDSSRTRHHLLQDDDVELYTLLQRLMSVHRSFYEEFDRRRRAAGSLTLPTDEGRIQDQEREIDLTIVPDVKDIMPALKKQVMRGVHLVFSGVLPLGTDIQNCDLSLWAKSFGVRIHSRINPRRTTHLIAGRPRTAKVKQAAKWPRRIRIVRPAWLIDSLTQWKKLDERPYEMEIHPEDRSNAIRARKEGKDVEEVEKERKEAGDINLEEEEVEDFLDDGDDYDGASMLSDDEDDDSESELEDEIRESTGLDEHSPIGITLEEQDAVHDELREFLGSDADDSSEESDIDFLLESRKRKRGGDGDGDEEAEEGDDDNESADPLSSFSSELAHRAKRPTGLREVSNVADEDDNGADAPAFSSAGGPGKTHSPVHFDRSKATLPTTTAPPEPPRALDPMRGASDESIDYNPYPPTVSPEAEHEDPTYTAADAYDNANSLRGGRAGVAGVVQPDEAYYVGDDDDELEREMMAAFEEDGWGAAAEEELQEGVGQGNEGGVSEAEKGGDVGGADQGEKEAMEEGRTGTWGGEGNGPQGVGDARMEEESPYDRWGVGGGP